MKKLKKILMEYFIKIIDFYEEYPALVSITTSILVSTIASFLATVIMVKFILK